MSLNLDKVVHHLIECRYRDAYVKVGSRTDSRDTFLCLSKEKYPKEKTPGCRLILRADDFAEGFRKGYP